jgi:hypothetical protein
MMQLSGFAKIWFCGRRESVLMNIGCLYDRQQHHAAEKISGSRGAYPGKKGRVYGDLFAVLTFKRAAMTYNRIAGRQGAAFRCGDTVKSCLSIFAR